MYAYYGGLNDFPTTAWSGGATFTGFGVVGYNPPPSLNFATIKLKRSLTSGNVPSSLAAGEFAQNLPDETLFYRNPSGVVTSFKLPDAERFITSGSVASAASLTISVDPAVIGVFRAFKLYLFDWIGSDDNQGMFRFRLGDATGIKSGGSDYATTIWFVSGNNFASNDNDTTDSSINLAAICNNKSPSGSQGGHWELIMAGNDPTFVGPNYVTSHGTNVEWNGTTSLYYKTIRWGVGRRVTRLNLTQFQLLFSAGTILFGRYVLLGIQ